MSIRQVNAAEVVSDLGFFDRVIDVRSPAEFAEDHLPGAVNWPVLDDEERKQVGTLYKQVSPLEARKVGAAMVARNIATHIDRWLRDEPKSWQPLVYCWRGGQRSGSLAWFLDQIGFRTRQLAGGYKAFRAVVREELETLPQRFDFRVLAGRTGSGKTRLLHALAHEGAQVLDLEALACHRGSVLGGIPGTPQPSQKRFDTVLWERLRAFEPARAVFVESESAKVGQLRVPESLIVHIREHGQCLAVQMPDAARVQLLLEDYGFFARDPEAFCRLLDALIELRGKDTVRAWQALARDGRWADVFADLMSRHYDPLYERSMQRHFSGLAQARTVGLCDGKPATLRAVAQRLVAEAGATVAGPQAGSSVMLEPPLGGGAGEP
uniref:tRNA 2-selenouridine synthase n=1 Tax=uncultured bacterium 4 TaxID=1748276 RepID=A0A0U3U7L1_9BACT|nr:tRNA 2-selenouridine synthase [uncultured bacterium 4]